MPESNPPAGRRDAHRHGARGPGGMRGLHLLISVFPAAVLALAGAGIAAFLLSGPHPAGVTRTVLFSAAAAAGLVLAASVWGAVAATRRVRSRLAGLRSASVRSQADLLLLAERVQQGDRPALRAPDPVPGAASDPFALLARDLQQERHAAREALLQVAARAPGGRADHRAEVSGSLAARMQGVVQQALQLLGQLKGQVWDPAVLQGLLEVDHLATRTYRHLESLAVVAGAGPLRQRAGSMTVHDVLQAAAAQVEHPGRVTVVPPAHFILRAGAAADVIHLVAELIDNATRFSPVQARTLVRADAVAAGLAVEVEDRGAMGASDRHRVNTLLSHPNRAEARQLLNGGRTGMFVVSELARRHGIEVQLQGNIYGGTQAVVVLPQQLLDDGSPDPAGPPLPRAEPAAPAAEAAATDPAATADPALPGIPEPPADLAASMGPGAAAGPHQPAGPAAEPTAAEPPPAAGRVNDDTPVMFRRAAPPPAAPAWPEPPPPAAPVWPEPPTAPAWPEPPAAGAAWPEPPPPLVPPDPPGEAGQQAAEPEESPLRATNGSGPYSAPPPREEPAAGREEPVADRIADLMAAFRNPAGQADTDQQ
ncbi:MAG: ATP-binding protein [Gemmatimonadota bacterium]